MMIIKRILPLILTAVILCGCAVSEKPEKYMTVTDMAGREVIIPEGCERVVCIGAGALRMYCYIGNVSLLCGVEDIDNLSLTERPKMFDTVARPYMLAYSDTFAKLPSCGTGGPNAQTAEAERILSCRPDIIISEYEDADKADALQEQTGVPVVTLRTGAGGVFDDALDGSLRLLGKVFGREKRADELIAFIDAQAAEISARTADIPEAEKPSVYICGLGNWGTTNHLMTAEDYIPFKTANVKNAVSGLGIKGIGPIEEEKLISIGEDIDIMIIDSAAVKNIIPLYKEDSGILNCCRAWRDGEAYLQMAYNAYYTNFETALINTWFIGKTVYPDRFADIDMKEKADGITEMFLGKALADEIYSCPSGFGGYGRIDKNIFNGE